MNLTNLTNLTSSNNMNTRSNVLCLLLLLITSSLSVVVTEATTGSSKTYQRRGQPRDDLSTLANQYGEWTLQLPRSTSVQYEDYPHRDVPRAAFPDNAWQTDGTYLSLFLPQALDMVKRAQQAILDEYAQTDESVMFGLDMINGTSLGNPGKDGGNRGGWTSTRSWEGLKRRLLHALMTEDSFVFAMGGHSAAAGHGNSFSQSYTLQVQWILEPVFARLGIQHESRNFGCGGLGTLHNALAAGSIYGPDVDLLMWDSSMTEKDGRSIDLFARQALLGGIKVPVLWSLSTNILQYLHDNADVDVGMAGTGHAGIPTQTTMAEVEALPWAAQYVRCSGDVAGLCRQNEYTGVCWIERDDFTPPTAQGNMEGRASWHPGNRKHQVQGRVLAYTILMALKEVLQEWNDAPDFVLDDDKWHMNAYYQNIREKVQALEGGACMDWGENLNFACNLPMQGRTEFTPRAYPSLTNIRTLMHPGHVSLMNAPPETIYQPPDVFNPALHPPLEAVDVLNIVENGIDFESIPVTDYTSHYAQPSIESLPSRPFYAASLDTYAGEDRCDGTVDSWCQRSADNPCLLYGHNDGRLGIKMDSLSGWVNMYLPNVKNGRIVVKFETWHAKESVSATADLETESNERVRSRQLKPPVPEYCDDFRFEYAIDGVEHSLNKEEFLAKRMEAQRVVELVVLLNDPNFTNGESKQVELAMRMTGCGRVKVFKFTHIYWT
eukprot:Nitzschia sp. Nitz4//scaffold398_size17708//4157//6632//NITZ4_008802-RA/size17708-augustus-gene-0.22-mRNA-1//1//CDS//3329550300//5308//frame0